MAQRSKSSDRHLRAQQAKEFLISQIVEEAQRENVPLSELERKMLYFTEAEESLPDIYEVNEQCEREYDISKYETKIAGLLREAHRRNRKESSESESHWKQAIADLRKEDHYLLVMVDQALELPAVAGYAIGIGISVVLCLLIVLWTELDEKGLIPGWVSKYLSDNPRLAFYLIALGALAVWFVVKLWKLNALGDLVKATYDGIRLTFHFRFSGNASGDSLGRSPIGKRNRIASGAPQGTILEHLSAILRRV